MLTRFKNRRKCCFDCNLAAAILCVLLLFPQTTGAVSDVEMTGFRISQETDSGRWEIHAGKAFYDGQGDVILQEVNARMVTEGMESVNVVSDTGRYESEKLLLHLEGHVVVASDRGSRFETPRLKWDGPGDWMLADKGVKFNRGPLRVQGGSVRYTVKSGTAIFAGGVRTTWDERSDRP